MDAETNKIHRKLALLLKKSSNGIIGPLHIERHQDETIDTFRVYTDVGECVTVSKYQEEDDTGTHTLYSFIDQAEFDAGFTPVSEEDFLWCIKNL